MLLNYSSNPLANCCLPCFFSCFVFVLAERREAFRGKMRKAGGSSAGGRGGPQDGGQALAGGMYEATFTFSRPSSATNQTHIVGRHSVVHEASHLQQRRKQLLIDTRSSN